MSMVLLKRHVRKSKYEPLCDEVELISITPTYAQVKHPSGREQTVSLRDLAPLPKMQSDQETPVTPHSTPGSIDTTVSSRPEIVLQPAVPQSPAPQPIVPQPPAPQPPAPQPPTPITTVRRSTRGVDRVDYSNMCNIFFQK